MLLVTHLCLASTLLGASPAPPALLSTAASTRATAYPMSNKLVTRDGRLHVAWLEANSHSVIRTLDLASGEWSDTVDLGPGHDNHAGPALTIDRDGYLHVLFGAHHHPFTYRRSLRPNDSSEWTEPAPVGELLTYPSLVCAPDGTLHLTARGGPAPFRLVYHRKPPGGEWSPRVTIVDPEIPPGYTQYDNHLAVDARGRLHLAFHIYDEHQRKAGKIAGYLRSDDGGESWGHADGTPVTLPATRETVDLLEHDADLDCRVGGMALDADGNPFIAVHHSAGRGQTPWLWHHDGGRWRARDLGPEVRAAVPGCFSAANPSTSITTDGTLYIAVPVAAVPGAWGHPSEEVVLLTSRDGGATFESVLISTPDPALPNWLPNLERNTGWNPVTRPHLLYTRGGPGTNNREPLPTEVYLLTLP